MGFLKILSFYRKTFGLVIIPIILSPVIILLDKEVSNILYVYILLSVYWILNILPYPVIGLMPLILLTFLKISSAKATALLYLQENNVEYLGGSILTTCMEVSRIGKRISLYIMLICKGNPRLIHAFIMFVSFTASLILSPLIVLLVMCPIIESILKILELLEIGKYFAHENVTYELVYGGSHPTLREKSTLFVSDDVKKIYSPNTSPNIQTIKSNAVDENNSKVPQAFLALAVEKSENFFENGLLQEDLSVIKLRSENSVTKDTNINKLLDSSENISYKSSDTIKTPGKVSEEQIEDIFDEKCIASLFGVSLQNETFDLDDELQYDKTNNNSDHKLNKKKKHPSLIKKGVEKQDQKKFLERFPEGFNYNFANFKKYTKIMFLPYGYYSPSKLTKCFYIGAVYSCSLGGFCNIIIPSKTNRKVKYILEENFVNSKFSLARWSILFYPINILTIIGVYFWLELLFLGLLRPRSKDSQFMKNYERRKIIKRIRGAIYQLGGITFKEGITIAILSLYCFSTILYHPINLPGWGILTNYELSYATIVFAVIIIAFGAPASTSFLESFNIKNLEKLCRKKPDDAFITWSNVHHTAYVGFVYSFGGLECLIYTMMKNKVAEYVFIKLHKQLPSNKFVQMVVSYLSVSFVTEVAEDIYLKDVLTIFYTLLSVDKQWNPLFLSFVAEKAVSHTFCTTLGSMLNLIMVYWCNVSQIDLFIAGIGAHLISTLIFFPIFLSIGDVLFNIYSYPSWASNINRENFTQPRL